VTAMFMINFKLISLSICGGSKDYQQIPRYLDLVLFIIFFLLFIVF
jgi:hypothetical protein